MPKYQVAQGNHHTGNQSENTTAPVGRQDTSSSGMRLSGALGPQCSVSKIRIPSFRIWDSVDTDKSPPAGSVNPGSSTMECCSIPDFRASFNDMNRFVPATPGQGSEFQ